jgi:hypothetical protein
MTANLVRKGLMMTNRWLLGALTAATLISIAVAARDAAACGGCFHEPISPTQTGTVVTDHRMIFSISTQETTLYDEITYAGSPTSFAWVLPIRGLVTVGLSSEAVFASLEAATATQIVAPPLTCPACNCFFGPGASTGGFANADGSAADAGAVTVLSQQTIGPYAAVQLQSTDPAALATWLAANGYVIPADIQPVIDAYVTEGFDFLALRLRPGQGIRAMRPVRVTSPGAGLSLPLRMVAAGTGATVGITLWVVADGRYEPQNFPFFTILPSELTWDWSESRSTYTTVQVQKEAAANNAAWQIESSLALSPIRIVSSVLNLPNDYMPLPGADAGVAADAGSIADARTGDLAALFPEGNAAVRITRIRADLLHTALANDLVLQASADQSTLSNVYQVTQSVNAPPCPVCPCGGSSSGAMMSSTDAGGSSGAMMSSTDAGGSSGAMMSSTDAAVSNGSMASGADSGGGSSSGSGAPNGVTDGSASPAVAPSAHQSSGCASVTSAPDEVAVPLAMGGLIAMSLLRSRRARGKKP